MRLGAHLFEEYGDAGQWVNAVRRRGYRAAYSPLKGGESDAEIDRYARAAEKADIVIAEVGVWRVNCISLDQTERAEALRRCAEGLAQADRLGARCCVSLSGSRAERWSGPHRDNLTEDVFALIVDNVRAIIDRVKPSRTSFTLEAMPWCYPCDVDSYERLLEAVDRAAFAVHYDPVNLVYSPDRYYRSGDYMREFVRRLGGKIRSCHCKDVELMDAYILRLDERPPGRGFLDYAALLKALEPLDADLPVMMEHLESDEQYDAGAKFLREKAAGLGISIG